MKAKCIDATGCSHITFNEEYEIIDQSEGTLWIINDKREGCYYQKERFEIIPDKILITDQMIIDVCGTRNMNWGLDAIRKYLKQLGYAVEEPKTKLDEIKELREKYPDGFSYITEKIFALYESYIEELNKTKKGDK